MNFPLIPALALPVYLFFGLPIFIALFGVVISLLPYSGIKKSWMFFWIVIPSILVAIISPEKTIFLVTELAYITGLFFGSVAFWFVFIFPKLTNTQLYKQGYQVFATLVVVSLFGVFVSFFVVPLEDILAPVFLCLTTFVSSTTLAVYFDNKRITEEKDQITIAFMKEIENKND